MLKNEDIQAIKNFNTTNHIYLEVVNKNGQAHLKAVQKKWFGRLLMKLGVSNASLFNAASYLNSIELNPERSSEVIKSNADRLIFINFSNKFQTYNHLSILPSTKIVKIAADKILNFVTYRG